jgi:hypothetical protein
VFCEDFGGHRHERSCASARESGRCGLTTWKAMNGKIRQEGCSVTDGSK